MTIATEMTAENMGRSTKMREFMLGGKGDVLVILNFVCKIMGNYAIVVGTLN